MTLNDLRLMVERGQRQEAKLQRIAHDLEPTEELICERFAGRQFWCGSVIEKNPRRKCFNHLIGLPEKNGKIHPAVYDYEANLIADLENGVKYQCIKKARGIGISTLYLRWLAFLACCRNSQYRHKRFAIVCGPRESLSIDLISRIKKMVAKYGIVRESERTICDMLGVTIEAFPSARVSTLRSFDNVVFAYIDEAAFFESKSDIEVRAAVEGYISKTNITIVMVSTPSVPGNMFEQIMEESDSTCLYKRYRLPYTVAVGKLLTKEEVAASMNSPVFDREMNLGFAYGLGNCFRETDIRACTIDYQQPTMAEILASPTPITIGCDVGFASSKLSYCVTTVLPSARPVTGDKPLIGVGEKAYVLEASEFERLPFSMATELIANVARKYGFSAWNRNVVLLIDGSRPEFCSQLKADLNEQAEYHSLLEYADKYRIGLDQLMSIIPIQFGRDGKVMMSHLQSMISDHELAISPRFNDLLLQLRMAKVKVTGMLDKSASSLDLVDSLMLSTWNYQKRLL